MNACPCGGQRLAVEARLVLQESGGWAGEELLSVTCERCGFPVRLDAARTVLLMHRLIEQRERGP